MEEQLINFQTAKLSKEKGFDLETISFYQIKDKVLVHELKALKINSHFYSKLPSFFILNNHNENTKWASAPSQSLLQKWLREKHNIILTVDFFYLDSSSFTYSYKITHFPLELKDRKRDYYKIIESFTFFGSTYSGAWDTYEECLENGLQKSLNLI